MAWSGSNWLWIHICGTPRVLRLFSSEPLWLLFLTFLNQVTESDTITCSLSFSSHKSDFFWSLPNSASIPEQSWQGPATPPHVGKLQRKEQLPHVTFEYVPSRNHHRKLDVLWPIGLPIPTLTNAIPLPSPGEKNTSWEELQQLLSCSWPHRMRNVTSSLLGALLEGTGGSQLYSCNINYWPGTAI